MREVKTQVISKADINIDHKDRSCLHGADDLDLDKAKDMNLCHIHKDQNY